jgi:hypothetical protein
MLDFDPGTTVGSSTFGVSLTGTVGTSGYALTGGGNYSYTVSDTEVRALALSAADDGVIWTHSFNPTKAVGGSLVQVKPAVVVQYSNGNYSPGGRIGERYSGEFRKRINLFKVVYAVSDIIVR